MTRSMLPIILASVLLTACGSDDTTSSSSDTPARAAEPAAAKVETDADALEAWAPAVAEQTGGEEGDSAAAECNPAADPADGYWCTTRWQMADNDQRGVVGYVREDGTVDVVEFAVGQSVEEARELVDEASHGEQAAEAPTL